MVAWIHGDFCPQMQVRFVGFADSPEYHNYSGIYTASSHESTVNGLTI